MMQRCYRPAEPTYLHYGARGIVVCERWHNFVNFLTDMGATPNGMQLDRIDKSGNYDPINCRWATPSQQARNKRNTLMIEFNGRRLSVADWADTVSINYQALRHRLHLGWSAARALTTPLQKATPR